MVKPFNPFDKTSKREIIDERYIRLFDNVEAGNIVARLYPPGKNDIVSTFDAANFPSPSDLGLIIDPSLELRAPTNNHSYATIVARNPGMLTQKDNELKIESNYKIVGGVDFHTGDIDFYGSVEIGGDVKTGFRIHAWNNVTVGGDVRGSIKTENGSVTVNGGIIGETIQVTASPYITSGAINQLIGLREFQIIAVKDIQATSIENTSVETKGSIYVNKDIRSSTIRVSGIIKVGGSISGGKVFVASHLEAQSLGNIRNTNTVINICRPVESSADFAKLNDEIAEYQQALQMSQLYLGPFVDDPQRLASLHEKYRQKMEEVIINYLDIKAKKVKAENRLNALLNESPAAPIYRVNFISALHPGVTVQFENFKFTTDTLITGPKTLEFSIQSNRFNLRDLIPIESP